MDAQSKTKTSKFLSFVLRHEPQSIGIELDANGWVDIDLLQRQTVAHGHELTRPILEEIVETSPKRRFAISDDGLRIRANQGHSVEVDLGYAAATPPEFLFHGTIAANLESIRARGLDRMSRHHVHLPGRQDAPRRPLVLPDGQWRVARRRGAARVRRVPGRLTKESR